MKTSLSCLLVITLFLASLGANWTTASAGGEEWRPLNPAHLALKAAVVEPNADAEALLWDIRVDDGGQNDLVLSPASKAFALLTPKAFANFSPGLVSTLGGLHRNVYNTESVGERPQKLLANAFSILNFWLTVSQGCRKLQPWAEISERLRRFNPPIAT